MPPLYQNPTERFEQASQAHAGSTSLLLNQNPIEQFKQAPQAPAGSTSLPQVGQSQYIVQPGDTLGGIARKLGVPSSQVTGYRSGNPNLIFPGEQLSVFPSVQQTPQAGQAQPSQAGQPQAPQAGQPQVPQTPQVNNLQQGQQQGQVGTLVSELAKTDPLAAERILSTLGASDEVFAQYGVDPASLEANFKTNPTQTLSALAEQVTSIIGTPAIRDDIVEVSDEIQQLEDERDRRKREVDDNPFLSLQTKAERKAELEKDYNDILSTRYNKLRNLQETYSESRDEARFVASTAIDLYSQNRQEQLDRLDAALERAEGRAEAITNAQIEGAPLVEEIVGGFRVLRNSETGEIVSTRSLSESSSGSTDTKSKTITLSSSDKQRLAGANFTSNDINDIEQAINDFGVQAVLDAADTEEQKAALRSIFNIPEPVDTKSAAERLLAVNFDTQFFGTRSGELQDAIDKTIEQVESLGIEGFTEAQTQEVIDNLEAITVSRSEAKRILKLKETLL